MSGLSSRFKNAGYKKPKFELPTEKGLNLFQSSVQSFENYFGSDRFCFIYRSCTVSEETLVRWLSELGLKKNDCTFVCLDYPTRGQADTVRIGLEELELSEDDNITIFNIDTIYREYRKPPQDIEFYIDVTKLPGHHWSFVEIEDEKHKTVARVTEKKRISELCSVGLYGFKNKKSFIEGYNKTYFDEVKEEHYIAPIFNSFIKQKIKVNYRYVDVATFDFLGTPTEYETFMNGRS